MSLSWDTPEYWARSEADEIVRDMPERDLGYLADSLETSAASYDDGLEMASLIVAELRRRAAASVRFWPALQSVAAENASSDANGPLEFADDEIPW